MYGPRSILQKAAQDAELAARVYPQIVKAMDQAGVPLLDRGRVLALIGEAMALGGMVDRERKPS